MFNDLLASPQNITGTAIILFELDDFGARKISLKVQDITKIGAAPRINRLPVVADHANILFRTSE